MTQAKADTKSSTINKQLDFYIRARKQYQGAVKPFTYQLNILSTQPKPKKFMIIINKFIDILKQGMKWQYSNDQQLKDNYWNELQKYYGEEQYEMAYLIDNSYDKKKNKIKLYFGLLLHNKKAFEVVREIVEKLGFMYEAPEMKLKNLDVAFQPVDFLKDGQFNIMSDFVNEYEKYQEKRKQQQKIKKQQAEKQRKRLQLIQQAKRKKQQQQKLQAQKKQKQQRQRLEKQRIERQFQQKQKQRKANTPANQSIDESIAYIPVKYDAVYNHDKTSELMRRRQELNQTTGDLPQRNQNKKHQKNSEILFEEKYKDEFEVFSFKLKPEMESPEGKKQVCAECKKELKQGFYFFGGNQSQCFYTGEWFCNDHMAEQRTPIPWKAIQSFDLRGYPVSRKSYIEIKSYYDKPIIQIKSDAQIVKHSKQLYDFLVLKRQIHLMYDSICDLELMQPLLKKKLNYCLKQNLFSLKNLYDIYNGHQGPSLQKQYDILSKHFYRCELCQKRKGYICPKCKYPVKIFAFELKETHGCSHCRKLYHRRCLPGGKCDCQDDQ